MTIASNPMPLLKLLSHAGLAVADIQGNPDTMVTGVATHAQRVERNNLFVAVRGVKTDSHMLLSDAVARGAAALVVEREIMPYPGVAVVRVDDTRRAVGLLAHAFLGRPARSMAVMGVTGTNGKTTVASMAAAMVERAGRRTGLVGTLGASWRGRSVDLGMTTPGPLELARVFAEMDEDRVDFVAMEVSSHALDQDRVAGLPFHAAVLTNISRDHLDYHGDLESYVAAKKRLFDCYAAETPGSVCVLNADDPVGAGMLESRRGTCVGYSIRPGAACEYVASDLQLRPGGTEFTLVAEGQPRRVRSNTIGAYNASNLLAAIASARALGVDWDPILDAAWHLPAVPGRLERVDEGQPFLVLVDYAHTPDALEKVLQAARRLTLGRVITVFGCGGNRDKTKRAPMGVVAGQLSDLVVVTSDNPRHEDPDAIARMAEEGLRQSGIKPMHAQKLLDREYAIERALQLARPDDCVVIAGKGHETYQEIAGRRYDFDDREVARLILRAMAGAWGGGADARQGRGVQVEGEVAG